MIELSPTIALAVRSLLGDSTHLVAPDVDAWLSHAEGLLDEAAAGEDTAPRSFVERHFEVACASIYDARLQRALRHFQVVSTSFAPDSRSPYGFLARLGGALAQTYLRRYPRAERSFYRAVEKAPPGMHPLLLRLADLLRLISTADWKRAPCERESEPVSAEDARLRALMEAYEAFAMARICLRCGRREEGLSFILSADSLMDQGLAPIPRVILLRTRGILNAVLGRSSAARKDLEESAQLANSVGYRAGMVHALLSLSQVNAPVDRDSALVALRKAEGVLNDDVDLSESDASHARQMPAERARLYGQRARVEFLRGRYEEAEHQAEQALASVIRLCGNSMEALPRHIAHARRNLGKIVLARGRAAEAVEHLAAAAELFGAVEDRVHEFYSLVEGVEANVALNDFPAATSTLERAEDCLACLPGQRSKEKAVALLLKAKVIWSRDHDDDIAQSLLRDVAEIFGKCDPDFYHGQALIAQAEVLLGSNDRVGAAHKLREAEMLANSLEIQSLKTRINEIYRQSRLPHEERDETGRFEMSVLYSDMRGFTAVSEQVQPIDMAEFLGEFASIASRCGSRHGGRPIRFLGDCVVIVFGVRDVTHRKECLALECACELSRLFDALCERWSHEHADAAGLRRLQLGFGLATGPVVAGRFGVGELSEYAVVGRAANLGARLQGVANGGEIAVCGATARTVMECYPGLLLETRDEVLKGLGRQEFLVARVTQAEMVLPLADPGRRRTPEERFVRGGRLGGA